MEICPLFYCSDKEEKAHRLVFDGGSSGNYQLDLCSKCYENQNKKFLIKEEKIPISKIIGPADKQDPNWRYIV